MFVGIPWNIIFQNVGIGWRHHYKVVAIGGRPFIEQLIVGHYWSDWLEII
jgi:hypothetical protein